MLAKLKRVLRTAAALVLGGAAVTAALITAGQQEDMSLSEWCAATRAYRDPSTYETFFLAFPVGTEIPQAWPQDTAGRLLGVCSSGTCTIDPGRCAVEYSYHLAPAAAGYRLAEVHAPPYIAGGWRRWALDTAGVHWWDSFAQVVDACRANFTGAECLQLLEADGRCWLLDDGTCCRYGKRGCAPSDSGLNGGACPYAQVVAPMPCTVSRGAGAELVDATKDWSESEYE